MIFWLVQAVWCFLTALPVYWDNIIDYSGLDSPISLRDQLGWAVWAVGFLLVRFRQCYLLVALVHTVLIEQEVTADFQKYSHKLAHPDTFMSSGVWRLCQHPNYAGEITCWVGIWLSATSRMSAVSQVTAFVGSPLFIAFLLIRVSGIPPLQRSAKKRWGENPEFLRYHASTPLLIPSLSKLFA